MTDKITPEMLDEARARAMLKEHLKGHEHWENVSANERAKWLRLTRAIREADDALGVPDRIQELDADVMALREALRTLTQTTKKQIVMPGGQRIGRNYKMGIAEGLERAARYLEAAPTYVHEGTMKQFAAAIRELKEMTACSN